MKNFNCFKNKEIVLFLSFIMLITTCKAQELKVIELLTPRKEGGKPLMNTLNERQSNRNFIDKALTDQQLSDLLWAAYGVNRPDEKKRTAPSAHDKQEIDIYVALANGTYRYDAFNNRLIEVNPQDIRSKTGKQGFTGTAAVNLIYVMDKKKASSKEDNEAIAWASICAGAIVQNVYLYCASEGMGCVVRGWVEKEILAKELNLSESQTILVTQTVGYIK